VTATRAGGQAQAGRWSLDPAGHVITDVMGRPLVFDALVADGELTLAANGQALRLRRSPA
jgi:hypothetical protein